MFRVCNLAMLHPGTSTHVDAHPSVRGTIGQGNFAGMRAHLLSLTYRLRAVQFMLTELAKDLEAVVAAHQPLATVFSDSPPWLELSSTVATAAVAAAHRPPSFQADLLLSIRRLRPDLLPVESQLINVSCSLPPI